MRRLTGILLAFLLVAPAPARAAGRALGPVRLNVSPAAGTTGAAAASSVFLQAARIHLNEATLLMMDDRPRLPRLDMRAGSKAAEYLARAALDTPVEAAEPSPQAAAARFVALALAYPLAREEARQRLFALNDPAADDLAMDLEAAGVFAERAPPLKSLAHDLRHEGYDAAALLGRFFEGRRRYSSFAPEEPAPAPVAVPDADDFARHAARRFLGGRQGHALAVLYRTAEEARAQGIAGDEEVLREVSLSPLTNPERERVIVELFRQAGAAPEEVLVQDVGLGRYGSRHNIYAVKKGRTDRVVVVGGHGDKVHEGAGTIDNWTGATMVVNLFQAMRDLDTEATYVFIVFAREEEGLVGSRKFVERLPPEWRGRVEAMINLDTLAVDGTFSWRNNSDRPLLDRVREAARAAGRALAEMVLWGGDSDSSSFRRAGIPAMTLLGASNDVIWDIIHSARDTIASFSLPHYVNAYHLTLELLKSLDRRPL